MVLVIGVMVVAMAVFLIGVMLLIGVGFVILFVWIVLWRCIGLGCEILRTLNDFIEFAAVEPYAAALRAVVNFNPLPVGHYQGYIAIRTVHNISFKIKNMVFDNAQNCTM